MKKFVLPVFAIAIALTSCSQADELSNNDGSLSAQHNTQLSSRTGGYDKNLIKTAPLQDQLEYKDFYLREAAAFVKKLNLSTKDLINLCHASEGQENTVVLRDIVEFSKDQGSYSEELEAEYLSLKDAFKDIDEGKNYNIALYIPEAELLISHYNENNSSDTYYFAQLDDSSQNKFFYNLWDETKQNFTPANNFVTENDAEAFATGGRALLVFDIQDVSLDPNPNFPQKGGNPVYSPPSNPPSPNPSKQYKVGNMTIKDHKESYVAGASEITVQMFRYENGVSQKISYINSTTVGQSEFIFAEFKRKDVRQQNQRYIGATLGGMINTASNVYPNTRLLYTIYEADNWPVQTRYDYFNVNGQNSNIKYGSSDGYYYSSNQHSLLMTNYADNGAIRFSPFLQ